MERASFAAMECPIARAVDEVGDGWTLLILREAYKGATTFSEFQKGLPITPTTLSRKLETLTSRAFFEMTTYQTNPPRERYELTAKALQLMPVLLALGAWGNRWLAPEGEILAVVDPDTGKAMDVTVVDRKTARPVLPGQAALKPGAGASKSLREKMKAPLVLGARHTRRTREAS